MPKYCSICGIKKTTKNTSIRKNSYFRTWCKKCESKWQLDHTIAEAKILGYFVICENCGEVRHLPMTKIKTSCKTGLCEECYKKYKHKQAIDINFKKCPKCQRILPIVNFTKNNKGLYYGYCNKCHAKYQKEQSIIHKNKIIKYRTSIQGLYRALIGRAKKRNLMLNISKNEFAKLISSPCKYCGELQENFNGIDRINSNKGYIKGNCVSCCKTCNYMKSSLNLDEFIIHINKIHQYELERKSNF